MLVFIHFFSYHLKEDHSHPIFGCEFNYMLRNGEPLILATVGHNRISIYECTNDFGLKLLMTFADPDVMKSLNVFSLFFSVKVLLLKSKHVFISIHRQKNFTLVRGQQIR